MRRANTRIARAAVSRLAWAASLLVTVGGCTQYQPFDSVAFLRGEYAKRLGPEPAQALEVPFALDDEILRILSERYKPGPNELRRVDQTLDFIFGRVDLQYSLNPTRDAVGTFRSRKGNCLSFVNLFVGVARHQRLSPFYVEVTDYQRWNYKDGLVVSRGHIVAGMYVKGKLKTYDFLPYRAKAYKDFKPVDDLTAAAHFYNNLGAEALMEGDVERALRTLQMAHQIAPAFVKAINNLGVAYARSGDLDKAVGVYLAGLEVEPQDVALLSNLSRTYQDLGRFDEATATLAKVDSSNNSNPFFFIYQSEVALARGDHGAALQYMTEALRRDSEVPEVQLGLVKVYLAAGEMEKARHHLERALKLDATNPEARRYVLMLGLMASGDGSKP